MESVILDRVNAGDPDYTLYWDLLTSDPAFFTFPDVGSGLDRLNTDRNVLFLTDVALASHLRDNPFHSQKLHIFGRQRARVVNIFLTKGSPLTQIMRKCVTRLREKGVLDHLKRVWAETVGKEDKDMAGLTTVVPGHGEMILAYAFMGGAFATTLMLVALEILWRRTIGREMRKRRKH